jgi:hypothetical protein
MSEDSTISHKDFEIPVREPREGDSVPIDPDEQEIRDLVASEEYQSGDIETMEKVRQLLLAKYGDRKLFTIDVNKGAEQYPDDFRQYLPGDKNPMVRAKADGDRLRPLERDGIAENMVDIAVKEFAESIDREPEDIRKLFTGAEEDQKFNRSYSKKKGFDALCSMYQSRDFAGEVVERAQTVLDRAPKSFRDLFSGKYKDLLNNPVVIERLAWLYDVDEDLY